MHVIGEPLQFFRPDFGFTLLAGGGDLLFAVLDGCQRGMTFRFGGTGGRAGSCGVECAVPMLGHQSGGIVGAAREERTGISPAVLRLSRSFPLPRRHEPVVEYAAQNTPGAEVPPAMQERLIAEAKALEQAGAALLDFTNSGPVVGPEVVAAAEIPVIGGFGGGPWLDGRVRMAHAAIGYGAKHLDREIETYANVAQTAFDAISAVADDVRSARQIKGGTGKKT